jgi:hypothetical protein
MLAYNCTEVSADGIQNCNYLVVLLEAGEENKGSKMEVLVTIKMYNLCGFDDNNDLEVEAVMS